ncbi:SDR family NAD(P)-dependent oxidoreductase [Thiorhodospira sibirica]|uniref:SDR family NAD(P)-dependent oxidoreductase n=1 Tax=Thiorhodospira sibirica TaxID=154347 RepID=UPI00022C1D71|nr:SDR family NAD(P)-dependent oxidoreductase [Thiorhodospira sibirica]
MITAEQLLAYRPTDLLLQDRVILITGAAMGMGRALSLACAAQGATVILLDKVIRELKAVYDAIEVAGSPQPAIYPLNFEGATAKDYQDLANTLGEQFGRLDGVVHNAAWIGALTPLRLYEVEMWSRTLMVNLHAPFLLSQAVLPLLEKAADPAMVFSTHDCQKAYWGAFGVAKAGQDGLLKILAHEYQDQPRIRINGVDTGPIKSALRAEHYPGEDADALPSPEERIWPYLYFLGPDAGHTTGLNVRL